MKKRFLAFVLSMIILAEVILPGNTLAVDAEEVSCTHHTEHTAECGYVEAVEGHGGSHVCDENCYKKTLTCSHEGGQHDEACGYAAAVAEVPEAACGHVCGEGCEIQIAECVHTEHTAECGYVEPVKEKACEYVCAECNQMSKDSTDEVGELTETAVTENVNQSTENVNSSETEQYVEKVNPNEIEQHANNASEYEEAEIDPYQYAPGFGWEILGEDYAEQLTTEELYEVMFQENTLRGLFNLVNENVDAMIGFSVQQIDGFEALIISIKESSLMDTDEAEALELLQDNVGTLREMKGICSVCGTEEGGHKASCVYFGEWISNFTISPANAKGGSGEVHFNKELIQDDKNNLAIQIEAWTEGNTVAVPTEIVVVLDHSASVYSPVDKNKLMNHETFVKTANTDKGKNFAGYYVVINKFFGGDEAEDINGNKIKDGDYCYALVRYNATYNNNEGRWERSHLIKFSEGEYNSRRVNSSFFDESPMRTQAELLALTNSNGGKFAWYPLENRQFNNKDTAIYFQSIYGATVDALTEFVNIVKDIPECKIAFTGFAGHGSNGTGIFNASTQKLAIDTNPSEAFFNASNTTALTNIINNYIPHFGGTSTQDGLAKAADIFATSNVSGKVNRAVMLFTDGIPTSYDKEKYSNLTAFNAALQEAYILKNTNKATLYSVGPAQAISDATGNEVYFMDYISSNYPLAESLDKPGDKKRDDANIIASNSTDLVNAFKKLGELIFNASKALNSQSQIRDTVTPYFDIGGGYDGGKITVVEIPYVKKEGQTPAFDENSKRILYDEDQNIKLVTLVRNNGVEYDQKLLDGSFVKRKGDQIIVSGYDYEKSTVYKEEGGGAKLRLIIPIKPTDSFIGGDFAVTNSEDSGIFSDGNTNVPVGGEYFEPPHADVVVKPEITANVSVNAHAGSFYLESVTLKDLASMVDVSIGEIKLDLSRDDLGLEDWQDDYVKIKVELRDSEGKSLGPDGLLHINGDTKFKVFLKVWSALDSNGNSVEEPDDSEGAFADGWIYVYYPKITFGDTTMYYGQELPNYDNYPAIDVEWITDKQFDDGDFVEKEVVFIGDKPQVFFEVDPIDTEVPWENKTEAIDDYVGKYGDILTKRDVAMNVRVYTQNEHENAPDAFKYAYFLHVPCKIGRQECQILPHEIGSKDFDQVYWMSEFNVHILTCQLYIDKENGEEGEPYIFDVYRKDKADNYVLYTTVSITADKEGKGTAIINELPIGYYKIVENTNWSWRYKPQELTVELKPSEEECTGVVTFKNELETNKWLNGFSTVIKNVFGISNVGQ